MSDHYIKSIMSSYRSDQQESKEETKKKDVQLKKDPLATVKNNGEIVKKKVNGNENDVANLLDTIKAFEISGNKKRLIKIDKDIEAILKLLYPAFKVDVTSFVNYLCQKFFDENPALITEIKKSFKNL